MRRGWIVGLSVTALVLTCCGSRLVTPGSHSRASSPRFSVVPDLAGDSMDSVYDQLEKAGLKASATDIHGGTDWTSESVVIKAKPAAGIRVSRGTTVTITSASKAEIAFYKKPMPDLRGSLWINSASGRAKAVSVYLSTSWRDARGNEKPGSIVGQSPAPGKRMKLGAPIKVTVANYESDDSAGSSGPSVPNVNWPNLCRHTKRC
jgi:beta-lactam-binding protein with PASTA domain